MDREMAEDRIISKEKFDALMGMPHNPKHGQIGIDMNLCRTWGWLTPESELEPDGWRSYVWDAVDAYMDEEFSELLQTAWGVFHFGPASTDPPGKFKEVQEAFEALFDRILGVFMCALYAGPDGKDLDTDEE